MRTVDFLRNEGFLVITLKDLKKQHLPDPEVLSLSIKRDEILITEDHGFGNIHDYPPYLTNGIILIITKTRKRITLHATLKIFLSETSFKELKVN